MGSWYADTIHFLAVWESAVTHFEVVLRTPGSEMLIFDLCALVESDLLWVFSVWFVRRR